MPESWYVTGGGKIAPWWGWWKRTKHMTKDAWYHAFEQWMLFPCDYLLSFYPKDVEKLALNTARHLLKTMPKEERWMILASMGNMLYNNNGPYDRGRESWKLGDAVSVKSLPAEGRGYCFLDPEGRERDIRVLLATNNKDWSWRWTVWRCENLAGSKDILALFPEEVEAMRKHFKGRASKVKDEAKAKNEVLLVAADEAMSSLSKEKRLARIALAMGLYYLDHKEAGCADGHLNPNTTFVLPDGTKHRGEEFVGEAPGVLQQVPHDAILEFYRQPIEQMARKIAEDRFGKIPAPLRDLLRAQLSHKLTKLDGSPAEIKEGESSVQTFDRTWKVPMDAVDREHTYFLNSAGQKLPYSICNTYEQGYVQTRRLVNLCAQILGKKETVKLIPPGNEKTEVDDTAPISTNSTTAGGSSIPPGKTALGSTTRKGADTPQDKLLAQGQTALREMPAEQRYAWLAEGIGFCFTENGTPAYQSEHTANANAVYVDAQGKVRKWTDAPGKDSPEWTAATNAARIVGYDLLTSPCKEEIRQLAVQTSKHILASMPPGLRQSWLAERNKLSFIPNAGNPYAEEKRTLESGVKISFQGTKGNYEKCLYYDPSGKIASTAAVEAVRKKNRWWLLYYGESVIGIDAINALFPSEVEAMRAAYKKSPFYKK